MAEIEIEINGVPHRVGCEDGQETRLTALAEIVDRHAAQLSERMGLFSDGRLFLMTALMIADELADAQDALAAGRAEIDATAPFVAAAAGPVEAPAPARATPATAAAPANSNESPAAEAAPSAQADAQNVDDAVAEGAAPSEAAAPADAAAPLDGAGLAAAASDLAKIPDELWLDPEMEAALQKLMNAAADRLTTLAAKIDAA